MAGIPKKLIVDGTKDLLVNELIIQVNELTVYSSDYINCLMAVNGHTATSSIDASVGIDTDYVIDDNESARLNDV